MVRNDKKQLEILRFIYETAEERGFPPTVREICSAVGLSSTSTVHGHIARLERKGFLIKDATKPRAIEVTDAGKKAIGASPSKIPMLSEATEELLELEDISAEKYFPLPPDLEGYNGTLFMLTVKSDSMIKAGILVGDQIIVRKQETASNNDIIIAITEESGVLLRRFYQEDDQYRLQAENDSIEPITLSDIKILGKVIGLYRSNI